MTSLKQRLHQRLQEHWLTHVTLSNNQIGLALLALLVGLASAGVITLFRFAIEIPLVEFLPMANEEDYEALAPFLRVALLLAGGALLIAIFHPLSKELRSLGVGHVLLRMERHQGYMPLPNLLLQWVAAAIALVSGHSVGREGPAVHLGAGTASQIGQHFHLAHHRLRILAGCGVASAISASFNTPMAGVIFAMEVVLLEYSIRGFIPIILASVTGAIVSEAVFGAETAFVIPAFDMKSLLEIPYILALGLMAGLTATAFIYSVKLFQKINHLPLWIKWGGLTSTTAIASLWLPQLLGIGYDTVNDALAGKVVVLTLFALMVGKLLLAAWAAATGFPGGLIGPSLFVGAALGGILGQLSAWWLPEYPVSVGFYAMLGMCAMMGATLRAPLAALVAMLELTANHNIIMPGMLAIVIASLVVSEIFNLPSVFQVLLSKNPLMQTPSPVQQMLRNTWVAQAMTRNIVCVNRHISHDSAALILQDKPEWLIIEDEKALLSTADLARAMADSPQELDLIAIPADREELGHIALKANLQDALDLMQGSQLQWLAVYRDNNFQHCVGVVSREQIEHFYRYQPENV
ncbi:chloride channel protein [Bacterioplanoides sp. SCSIO 12839]|uniref:chloride channel protein n=1 Tax=Bacterioplanoides sp. SCSIO 12839 TaxID=2829569 RepID=UPI0021037E4E|nr:chloride channel protein [Bacterioplanoides sp. SCSIO 12839]UTW48549.1 chloride channel protein [Bacterioplanoides sp. SCSIO 12839]